MSARTAHSVPHRAADPLAGLYPAIEPYHLGRLGVDARHDQIGRAHV